MDKIKRVRRKGGKGGGGGGTYIQQTLFQFVQVFLFSLQESKHKVDGPDNHWVVEL